MHPWNVEVITIEQRKICKNIIFLVIKIYTHKMTVNCFAFICTFELVLNVEAIFGIFLCL